MKSSRSFRFPLLHLLGVLSLLVLTAHSENMTRTGDAKLLTAFNGAVASDILNPISVGKYGPLTLLNDDFFEKLQHLVRERIPERRVSAKGNGAFGFFECTNPEIASITKADLFSKSGKKTPIVVRFSRAFGRSGSVESVRGSQSMAIKFYTDEGNWDLLTNNFPVFSIRDPTRFAELQHALSPNPINNLPDPNIRFDYMTKVPETLHRLTWTYTDAGLPDGWEHMNTYAVNTFKFVNSEDQILFVRFQTTTHQGLKSLEDDQAAEIAGRDPNYFSGKLYDAINQGNTLKWLLKAQFMTEKQALEASFNPFDATKLWRTSEYPLITLGKIVLNKNPTNWFSQIESLAFNPANLVPGIEPSLDRLLQGRLFSYRDAHFYRLGANAHKLPINMPRNKLHQPHIRDGACTDYANGGTEPSYFPNSYGKSQNPEGRIVPAKVAAAEMKHYNTLDDDNYSQVGETWRSFSREEQKKIIGRLSNDLVSVDLEIQARLVKELGKADPKYAKMLVKALQKSFLVEEPDT